MNEGIFVAASAASKQQRKMDVIANNLANLNSTGFKKDQLAFEAIMTPYKQDLSFDDSRNILQPPALSTTDVAYVTVGGFSTNHAQGSLTTTGNALDISLQGKGFFKVQTAEGARYTRKGDFRLNNKNQLATQEGDLVLDEKDGPITIQAFGQPITVDSNGTVSLGTGSIAKINVVDFKDASKLIKEGSGLFKMTDAAAKEEPPPVDTVVKQGFLESSNVNSVEEMTNMLETTRTFDAYAKVIQALDKLDGDSTNTLGRVG